MTETLLHGDLRALDALYPAGEPLPESSPHEIMRGEAASMLRQFFCDRGDVWVASNRNLYFVEGSRSAVVEPDVMVVSGVPAAGLDTVASYRTWQHGGSIRFVLEVASKETQRLDRGHKRAVYASIGVAEYWRIDPTGGELCSAVIQPERLVDGSWTPIDVTVTPEGSWSGHSESLGLDIVWQDGEILFHPAGSDRPLDNLARAAATVRDAEAAQRAAEQQSAAYEAEIERLKGMLHSERSADSDGHRDPPPAA